MNAAKAASRMRSRTAVSSPPSWRRLGIDALAINLSLTTPVPYSTTGKWLAFGLPTRRKVANHETFARFLHLMSVWYPLVPTQHPNFREESKEPNNEY